MRLSELHDYLVSQGYGIESLRGTADSSDNVEVVWADGVDPDLAITAAIDSYIAGPPATLEERIAALETAVADLQRGEL